MKNLSLQITSPKFLDESFTTQMDLLTGKVFYHSQLGEYLNMLPDDISHAIEKAIWKYIFSQKVLAIPHPIHIDYYDNHTMKQDIQLYIDREIQKQQQLLDQSTEIKKVGYKEKLEAAKSIQPIDVINASPPAGRGIVEWKEHHCRRIKEQVERSGTFPTMSESSWITATKKCQWFNKDGCMCGISDNVRSRIPQCLYDKYAPLDGKCGFQTIDYRRVLVCGCYKHIFDIREEPQDPEKIERILDEYLEQHNYYYKHGCWVKGNPEEGFTWNKTRKQPQKVPYKEVRSMYYKQQEFKLTRSGGQERDHVRSTRRVRDVYLPKLSKRCEKVMGVPELYR